MENLFYDVIIVGGGPAGFTAALYAARAKLETLLMERQFSGGQMATTDWMENYPGFEEAVSGFDLAIRMENQARKFGARILNEQVIELNLDEDQKSVTTPNASYFSKSIILCMGTTPKTLGLPKEDDFQGSGLSICATCDGALYRDKVVAVIGGGNSAAQEALFLTRFCAKVWMIHRGSSLRATPILRDELLNHRKIEVILNSEVCELLGNGRLEGIRIKNSVTQAKTMMEVDGIFIAIGSLPNSQLVKSKINLSPEGYILTNETMETGVPGVYAAGDIRQKVLRQVITAAADGAIAAYMAERYISERNK